MRTAINEILGIVKVLSNVEYNLFSNFFSNNFRLSKLDQPNFDYPQMRKITKRYLCCICTWMNPSKFKKIHPQSKEPVGKRKEYKYKQVSTKENSKFRMREQLSRKRDQKCGNKTKRKNIMKTRQKLKNGTLNDFMWNVRK